jgi:hypothetical protein
VLLAAGDRVLEFSVNDLVGDRMLEVEVSGLKSSAILSVRGSEDLARRGTHKVERRERTGW